MKQSLWLVRALQISVLLALPLHMVRLDLFGVPTSPLEILIVTGFLYALSRKIIVLSVFTWFEKLGIVLFIVGSVWGAFLGGDERALGILKSWIFSPLLLYIWLRAEWRHSNQLSFVRLWLPRLAAVQGGLIAVHALTQIAWQKFPIVFELVHPDVQHYLQESPIRVVSFFESPNYLAMYLLPIAVLSLWGIAGKATGWLLFQRLSTGLMLLAVFFTRSQGAYLAIFLGFAALGLALCWPRLKLTYIRIFTALGLFLLAAALFSTVYVPRPGGGEIRREIYAYSLEMISESPISGIGLGQFGEQIALLSRENVSFQEYALPYALHAHSLYLSAWLEIGVLGLFGLLSIFLVALRSAFRSKEPILVTALIVILAHGLVDTTFFRGDLAALSWVLVAAALSCGVSKK